MLEVLNLNENNCADCYKCIRTCSVKAITYANNTAEIVHDECILCGNCFVACPQKAKQVRNDVPRVKEAIAAGKHVVCSLAPSFIADFRIRSLDVMTDALKRLGFAEVQETAVGAQLVSDEYARIMREGKQRVLISSCCPSINMLIQKYYPTMLPHLAKVLTPMQAHCKAIKEQNPEAFTVFIGPCHRQKGRGRRKPLYRYRPHLRRAARLAGRRAYRAAHRPCGAGRRQARALLSRHRRRAQGHRQGGGIPPHRHRRRGQLPRRV